MAHARSDEGQFLRYIFVETGMTIEDWNNLDPRQQAWWMESTNEKLKRDTRARDRAARGLKGRGRR